LKTFLVQLSNGQIKNDFAWHLRESIIYQNWFNGEDVYEIKYYNYPTLFSMECTKNQYKDCIPVGSLEFIFEYTKLFYNKERKDYRPINIPYILMEDEYLKRCCYYTNIKTLRYDENCEDTLFIKSASEYKKFAEIMKEKDICKLPDDYYLISEVVDIKSEWRCFVFNNELVGVQNYGGNFTLFPDIELVKYMIRYYKYNGAPGAYTLDIAINDKGTFLIEIHPYVSCGNYGFSDYRIIPQMFVTAWNYFINN